MLADWVRLRTNACITGLKKRLTDFVHSAEPSICMDVAEWAKQRGVFCQTLYPAIAGEIEPHLAEDPEAIKEFLLHKDVFHRPQSLVCLEGASVRDLVGIVELPDGQICYEGNWGLQYLIEQHAYKRRFSIRNRKLQGNIYSLLSLWSPEFYHWFHDVLPRLENALPFLPSDTRFLIHNSPKQWHLDSLAAYGIDAARLEAQENVLHTHVERLWFATPMGHTALGSGVVIRRVADRLIRHFGLQAVPISGKRIFISRGKAERRRIVNEKELEPFLEKSGFESVVLEDLPLREQIRLFASAEALVAPHGAGLINMIYMRPEKSRVTELYAGKEPLPCYLVLAHQLGFRFQRPSGVHFINEQCDMHVPVASLLQATNEPGTV